MLRLVCGHITPVLALLALTSAAVGQAAPELFGPEQGVDMTLGGKAEFTYRVQWPGEPEDWLIPPPEVPDSHRDRMALAGVEVQQHEGVNVLAYRFEFSPSSAGNVEIPPLSFHFQEGGAPLEVDETGGIVLPHRFMKSAPVALRVREPLNLPPAWVLASGGGVALVLAGLGGVFLLRRRGQKNVPKAVPLEELLRQWMHDARGARLDGDFYGYYKKLAAVAERVARFVEDGAVLQARLQERTQGVGYRGLKATDETMDADWREVERALARYRESLT